MTQYKTRAPDGNFYTVEGPEGASDDDVQAEVLRQNPQAASEPPKTAWQQTKGMLPKSVEFVLGAGSGLASSIAGGYAGLASAPFVGADRAADIVRKTQEALTYQPESKTAEKGLELASIPAQKLIREPGQKFGDWSERELGFSPLAATAMNIVPDTAAAAFGLRFPGTRTSFAEKVLPGGELPGVAAARATRQAVNAPADAAALAANRAGFKLPPSDVNPSFLNRTLEWIADKGKNKQVMAAENQPLVQAKIREQFKLRPDEPLDYNTFERVKHDNLIHYEAARRTGKSNVSTEYLDDIAKTLDPLERAQQAYPGDAPSPAIARGNALVENVFNADAAVTKIRDLRADAKAAKVRGEEALAEQYKSYANAVEAELGRHLDRTGQPMEVIQNYRTARSRIAQAEDIQKSLSRADEVNPSTLREMQKKGAPFVEGMADVANLGRFDRASGLPSKVGAVQPFSNLELLAAAMTGSKNLLSLGARPITRALINSDAFQGQMGRTYGQSRTGKTVQALTSPDAVVRAESFNQATEARKRELLRQLGIGE